MRTHYQRFAANSAQIEHHPARFPTLARNCEFLPLTIPHYKFFGGFYYYLHGQSVGHKYPAKRFICGYCAVKIPDWRHRRGAFNLPRSTAATKLKHRSKAKQPSLLRSLKLKKKEKEMKLNRRIRQMLHPGKVQGKNLKPQHG